MGVATKLLILLSLLIAVSALIVLYLLRQYVFDKQERLLRLSVENGVGRFDWASHGDDIEVINDSDDVSIGGVSNADQILNRVGKHFGKTWKAKKLRDRKHIILFFGADYDENNVIHVDKDCNSIKEVLKGSDIFHVVEKYDVKREDIVPLITQFKPSIIHFDGHGTENGDMAVFPNIKGKKFDLVSSDELNGVLNAVKSYVRLCYFDVCNSIDCAKNAALLVDAAIGVSGKLPVDGARAFSKQFYLSLENEHTIKEAFDSAKAHLILCNMKNTANALRIEFSVEASGKELKFDAKQTMEG